MKVNVVNKNNSPVNIRFVTKTSDIRNFSENIRPDVKTSKVATLLPSANQHKTHSNINCVFIL